MAFNNVGHYWLANGGSMWVTIRFSGEDRGAQWIMANPLPFDTFPTPSGTTQLEIEQVPETLSLCQWRHGLVL